MAIVETSRALNEGVRADARGAFSALIGTLVAWNDRRMTRKALSTLSARELDDIGLSRGDIYEM